MTSAVEERNKLRIVFKYATELLEGLPQILRFRYATRVSSLNKKKLYKRLESTIFVLNLKAELWRSDSKLSFKFRFKGSGVEGLHG